MCWLAGNQLASIYPTTEHALWAWIVTLMLGYVLLAYLLRWQRGLLKPGDKFYLTVVFDSGVFAGSAAVIAGIYLEDVLKLLGNMTAFLAIASMVGILYSLHALLEKR